jgi:hypothetical protein
MAGPTPTVKKLSEIKTRLLKPALTSHFVCEFKPPGPVITHINERIGAGIPSINHSNPNDQELIRLSCSEASLPGSSLATIDIDNDFHRRF